MFKKLLLVVLFLCIPSTLAISSVTPAKPDSGLLNVGRSPFGLTSPNFKCTSFLSNMDKLNEWHIAFVYNTFGNDFRCLNKVLASPKLKTLMIHLINEPCHRSNRCGSYEFLYPIKTPADYNNLLAKKDKKLHNRFLRYVKLLQNELKDKLDTTRTQLLISPGLESNPKSGSAARELIKWSHAAFPQARVDYNPAWGDANGPLRKFGVGEDLVEGHGPIPQFKSKLACTVNMDGSDINFNLRPTGYSVEDRGNYINEGAPLQQYTETYANQCEVAFLWSVEDNCDNDPWRDPRKRLCRGAVKTNPLMTAVIKHANVYGKPAPLVWAWSDKDLTSFKGCKEIRNPNDGYKVGFVMKQSEFANRGGVVLLPTNLFSAGAVEIVKAGKVINTYERNGDFIGRPLYRSNLSPVKLPFYVNIRVTMPHNKYVCYKMNNPRARND